MKIGLITSPGGHLFQLYQLEKWWKKYDRFWVTKKSEDVRHLLKKEKVFYGFFPENRNLLNSTRNLILSIKILIRERPNILISTGASIAVPFFYVAKILGCKLIYMETYDFIEYPTLSAKLVSPIVDLLLVQNEIQKKYFKKAVFWGATL
ncbi:MAG: PssD/Cps14F family polysaccharide biosynthesis glycosyltransferase [Patescibacteria group bacterium]